VYDKEHLRQTPLHVSIYNNQLHIEQRNQRLLGFRCYVTSDTILNYTLQDPRFIRKTEYQIAFPSKTKVIFLQNPIDTIKNHSVFMA